MQTNVIKAGNSLTKDINSDKKYVCSLKAAVCQQYPVLRRVFNALLNYHCGTLFDLNVFDQPNSNNKVLSKDGFLQNIFN